MENKRSDIIHAAIDLFCEKGLEAASIMDIAKKAGIGKSTTYFYFESKEQLVNEVFQYCFQLSQNYYKSKELDNLSAIELLHERFKRMFIFMKEHPKEALIENLYGNSSAYNQDPYFLVNNDYYKDLKDIISSGMAKGEIKKGDVTIMTNAYYGFLMQTYFMVRVDVSTYNSNLEKKSLDYIDSIFKL